MSIAEIRTTEIAALTSPSTDLSDIKVSKKSHIYDLTWDFIEDLRHRPRSLIDSRLRVNWEKWPFSECLRRELQHIFGLYHKAPSTLSKNSRELKPNSLVSRIERSLDFLCCALQTITSADLIDSLDQVTLIDLQQAAKVHPSSDKSIKLGLKILFHPYAAKVLGKTFKVTQGDINSLPIKRPISKKSPEQLIQDIEGPALLSDDLFALLSDEATARVHDFLRRLGVGTEDNSNYGYEAPSAIPPNPDFSGMLYIYEQMRRARRHLPYDDTLFNKQHPRHHVNKLMSTKLMRDYLTEVNQAAQCVIGLYAGPRFSELASLEVGCLTERDRVSCIIGRSFKGKRDSNIRDDAWVAIPAVRDAVRALEKLAHLKNNKFLISSLDTSGGKSTNYESPRTSRGMAYSCGGFAEAMEQFIKIADKQGRYAGWKFNTHQFKHSITRQLIKAKLGLAYISFHLKHLHSRISTLPSEVTLNYGNAGKVFQSEMAGYQIQELKRDLARKMYDPDSPVHGGAAPEFDARRKSYFKGMTDSGNSKEQIIDELASLADSAFVNVGLGYCMGRKDDPNTGEKPPCIGNLRCNPNRCSNAIITKEAHGPAWQRIAFENRKMERDPRFAYGKAQFEAAAEEAEEVCRHIGIEVDNG